MSAPSSPSSSSRHHSQTSGSAPPPPAAPAVTLERIRLPEQIVPGARRLGRHVLHDPRSWLYPAAMASTIRSVRHTRLVGIFDQDDLGSCTGEAGVGCVSTAPFTHHGTQPEAVDVYGAATRIDPFPGSYPPDDTGSSGLAVAKVLVQRGLIKSYAHTFTLDALLRALVLRPGIVGISWRTGCDNPRGASGLVQYTGSIRGGHEIVASGIDASSRTPSRRLVIFDNSWGTLWGVKGSFAMTWGDLDKALHDHGDAIFFNAA